MTILTTQFDRGTIVPMLSYGRWSNSEFRLGNYDTDDDDDDGTGEKQDYDPREDLGMMFDEEDLANQYEN
jgi:hypothetical protein